MSEIFNKTILVLLLMSLQNYSLAEIDDSVLSYLANEKNKHLPMMIDKETRLVNVSGFNNRFTYFYKFVNFEKSNINVRKLKIAMSKKLLSFVCTQPESIKLIKQGMTAAYNYSDKHNNYIMEIIIYPENCGF